MTTDTPFVATVLLLEPVMSAHQIVEIGNFKGGVIEGGSAGAKKKQAMMIARNGSAIATQERSDRLLRRSGVNLIGSDQSEARLVPCFGLAEVLHIQNTMAQPLDVRRSRRDALQEVQPFSVMNIVRSNGRRRFNTFGAAASGYYLDTKTIGVAKSYQPPTTWTFEVLNRGIFGIRQRS